MADRMPTIIDVAARAGVSKSAASRALLGQGRISEESRLRVLRAAQELGYVKNAMAQGLSAHRTGTLGVLVRDPASLFYGRMHQALQRRASERGYRVVTATGNLSLDDEVRALETLVSLQIDGLVVSSGLLPTRRVEAFAERIPTVIAGRQETGQLVGSVYCDERDGARQLVAHLLAQGHESVAVVTVPKSVSLTIHMRGAEMVRVLRRHKVEVLRIEHVPGRPEVEHPGVAVLRDRPAVTAVMCPADTDALGVLNTLHLMGLRVPEDISVTGYDGVAPLDAPILGLTTLAQPIDEIGARAVDVVVDMLDGGLGAAHHVRLLGTVLPGRTTGPAKPR